MSPHFDEFVKSLKDCKKASERGVLQAYFPYVVALGKSGKCKSKKAEIIKYYDLARKYHQTVTGERDGNQALEQSPFSDSSFCNAGESKKSK